MRYKPCLGCHSDDPERGVVVVTASLMGTWALLWAHSAFVCGWNFP